MHAVPSVCFSLCMCVIKHKYICSAKANTQVDRYKQTHESAHTNIHNKPNTITCAKDEGSKFSSAQEHDLVKFIFIKYSKELLITQDYYYYYTTTTITTKTSFTTMLHFGNDDKFKTEFWRFIAVGRHKNKIKFLISSCVTQCVHKFIIVFHVPGGSKINERRKIRKHHEDRKKKASLKMKKKVRLGKRLMFGKEKSPPLHSQHHQASFLFLSSSPAVGCHGSENLFSSPPPAALSHTESLARICLSLISPMACAKFDLNRLGQKCQVPAHLTEEMLAW